MTNGMGALVLRLAHLLLFTEPPHSAAIRMAQDLGLFRDVEKWFLPIQRFTHEEKQTRKRIWWACVILGESLVLPLLGPGLTSST